MDPVRSALAISGLLFVGMMICLDIGYRLGTPPDSAGSDLTHEGVGAIEAAVFALLGLLLGFSFAGATSRLDARRDLIVKEANAIGTAYLRLDLLPANEQPAMRKLFSDYLDARLSAYQKLPDVAAANQEFTHADQLQKDIWSGAVAAYNSTHSEAIERTVLPAINDMIDVTTSRTVALHTHLPALIFALLITVALLSGLLAGFAMAKRRTRSWMHTILYAFVVSITIYAVLDLDYPRGGVIRLTAADKALTQLRDSIR